MSMATSPLAVHMYDVLDHTNHIFCESLSSGDDIDRDEDLQKDKYKDKDTQTHRHRHAHRQSQIQSASNTQCMLYLSKAAGSRI